MSEIALGRVARSIPRRGVVNCAEPKRDRAFPTASGAKLAKARPWVQGAFLAVWLAPLGRWVQGIPGCVFHCYSCPLSSFACPVGVAANYAALLPASLEAPLMLAGVLLAVGAVGGTLACGWACPFGFLQDLLARLTEWKLRLPRWLGHLRYGVLVGLVLVLPLVLGARGTPFEEQAISICRVCPAGALEAGLPHSIRSMAAGEGWLMSGAKTAILVVFLLAAVFIRRPWCRVFCPLGGALALFNRVSVFHLRFRRGACIECNLCRTRCAMGVNVDERINVTGCIRCLECVKCGAVQPSWGRTREHGSD